MARWKRRVRRSQLNSLAAAMLCLAARPAASQTPGSRVSYRVRVMEQAAADTARVLAIGSISGPEETNLRLRLLTDTVEVEALLDLQGEPDTVRLGGAFHARHRMGRSSRGLDLWEVDAYRRAIRLPWGGTVRLYPFGARRSPRDLALWLEITVSRDLVAGNTRPEETVTIGDSSVRVTMEALVRPRRAAVRLTLFRGTAVSAPKVFEMVANAPGRLVTFVPERGEARTVLVALVSPEPPASAGDSALGVGTDVLCLRVTDPAANQVASAQCGRLNNVARRLPLSDGDTLLATLAWPAPR
jgi:hypothetical protein